MELPSSFSEHQRTGPADLADFEYFAGNFSTPLLMSVKHIPVEMLSEDKFRGEDTGHEVLATLSSLQSTGAVHFSTRITHTHSFLPGIL